MDTEAATVTKYINHASHNDYPNIVTESETFNVTAGFTGARITSGSIDDRGMLSINGGNVLFQCSSQNGNFEPPYGCQNVYHDNGIYRVLPINAPPSPSAACNIGNAVSYPIDITSRIHGGNNTISHH